MSSVASGEVSQNNLSGSELLYTDTGSYGTIISRTLNVYDFEGNLFANYNMGSNLTQVVTITADGYYQFICHVVDNTGTLPPVEKDYVAVGFYYAAYLARFSQTQCGCDPKGCFIDEAEANYNAALRFNLAGNPVAAQNCITNANTLINIY